MGDFIELEIGIIESRLRELGLTVDERENGFFFEFMGFKRWAFKTSIQKDLWRLLNLSKLERALK